MTYEITPENLVYHTLIGLETVIAGSTNPDMVGIGGVVVDETRNTLRLATGYSDFSSVKEAATALAFRSGVGDASPKIGETGAADKPAEAGDHFLDKTIPKAHSTFIFSLPDDRKVQVDGDLLVARPEDRISKKHKN